MDTSQVVLSLSRERSFSLGLGMAVENRERAISRRPLCQSPREKFLFFYCALTLEASAAFLHRSAPFSETAKRVGRVGERRRERSLADGGKSPAQAPGGKFLRRPRLIRAADRPTVCRIFSGPRGRAENGPIFDPFLPLFLHT